MKRFLLLLQLFFVGFSLYGETVIVKSRGEKYTTFDLHNDSEILFLHGIYHIIDIEGLEKFNNLSLVVIDHCSFEDSDFQFFDAIKMPYRLKLDFVSIQNLNFVGRLENVTGIYLSECFITNYDIACVSPKNSLNAFYCLDNFDSSNLWEQLHLFQNLEYLIVNNETIPKNANSILDELVSQKVKFWLGSDMNWYAVKKGLGSSVVENINILDSLFRL